MLGRESAVLVLITDRVVRRLVAGERIGLAAHVVIPPAIQLTDAETGNVDVAFIEQCFLVGGIVDIVTQRDDAGECAVLGVVLGLEGDLTAGPEVYVGVAGNMVTETHFGTDVTADRKACFRPRNIKIAGTVGVANANIFHGLGFRRHDGVGCAGSRGRGKGGNGGKKDSSDIHLEWP